jgi:serine protease Do
MNTTDFHFSRRHARRWRGVLFLGAAVALGWAVAAFADDHLADKEVVVAIDKTPLDRSGGQFPSVSFAPVIQEVGPAVVQVTVTAEAERVSEADLPPFLRDPRWRRFFDIPDNFEQPRRPPQQGAGSGVIVSSDGYILTNNHVVENATEIEVRLSDRREVMAEVIGTDPDTDLAVIKVDLEDLPAVTFTDSDQLEVGDIVLAVGNPFGLGQTVTSGIVSGLGRATLGLGYEDFIQTDAAINPGNSGGALVDAHGRLIGINTAILSRSGGFMGIGFAIPSNLARNVMQQLVAYGEVTRGFLGFYGADLTRDLAPEFGLDEDQRGTLVQEVTEDTPAERAGLEHGDIITHLNGKRMENFRELRFAIADVRPGTEIELTVIRDGEDVELEATVGSRDGLNEEAVEPTDDGALEGVGVSDIDPRARERFGIPSRVQGALVVEVDPSSAAARVGLRPGMVIVEINRQRVRDADEAVELTEESSPNDRTLLRIYSARLGFRYIMVDESDR